MCEGTRATETSMRDQILSLKKPVIFRGMIHDWKVLQWGLEGWNTVFGARKIPFRRGMKACSPHPLWEGKSSTEEMTFGQFSDLTSKHSTELKEGDKWYYFDYKYIHEWFPSEELGSVTWDAFGFPDHNAEDSTLWIGSKGAHTPCHYDTYGVNLVAQVFGSKRWTLFPPSETKNMKPTRVPYEESSIYSQLNFSCSLPPDFYLGLGEVYIIDLKPGDVLFVPQHWWHYVESLGTSVSINTWLPTKQDDINHLDESLVKFFMSLVSKQLNKEERETVLNPSESDIHTTELLQNINLVDFMASGLIHTLADANAEQTKSIEPPSKRAKLEEYSISELSSWLGENNAELLMCSNPDALKAIMDGKCTCSSREKHQNVMTKLDSFSTLQKVLNAFLQPEVIIKVREMLVKDYTKS